LAALDILTTLDLSGNTLESWPECINALPGLEKLEIAKNQLKELI